MKKNLFILIAIVLFPSFVLAHPGNTDSSGCHTCRTNCANWGLSTGEYHCHNAKIAPQPIESIKSTYGANGTGYTAPAPEYKQTINTEVKEKPIIIQPKIVTPITEIKKIIPTSTKATSSVISEVKKEQPIVTPIKIETKKVGWFRSFINWFR